MVMRTKMIMILITLIRGEKRLKVMMTKMIMMVIMAKMIMMMITLRGEKRLEVENEIRKQVDNIMREELDLLKMVSFS